MCCKISLYYSLVAICNSLYGVLRYICTELCDLTYQTDYIFLLLHRELRRVTLIIPTNAII